MFCDKCGNQIADGQKFCNKCGAPVGGAAQNAGAQPAYQPAKAAAGNPFASLQKGILKKVPSMLINIAALASYVWMFIRIFSPFALQWIVNSSATAAYSIRSLNHLTGAVASTIIAIIFLVIAASAIVLRMFVKQIPIYVLAAPVFSSFMMIIVFIVECVQVGEAGVLSISFGGILFLILALTSMFLTFVAFVKDFGVKPEIKKPAQPDVQ